MQGNTQGMGAYMIFFSIKQLPASSRNLIGMTIFKFPVGKKKKGHKKFLLLCIMPKKVFCSLQQRPENVIYLSITKKSDWVLEV